MLRLRLYQCREIWKEENKVSPIWATLLSSKCNDGIAIGMCRTKVVATDAFLPIGYGISENVVSGSNTSGRFDFCSAAFAGSIEIGMRNYFSGLVLESYVAAGMISVVMGIERRSSVIILLLPSNDRSVREFIVSTTATFCHLSSRQWFLPFSVKVPHPAAKMFH